VNLNLYAGDDFVMVVTVQNDDGSAVDLTGYTAVSQIKTRIGDATPLATFTCVTGGTAGTVTMTLPNAESASLTSGVVYDMQITSSGGVITTLIAGSLTINPQVTTP